MAPQRDNQFKMLLSEEELKMLRALAEHSGLSASDLIRQFIRREYSERSDALELAAKERAILKSTEFARQLDRMVRPARAALDRSTAPAMAAEKQLGAAGRIVQRQNRAVAKHVEKVLPRSAKRR